jgi:glycosyltransferase involved in cell wall biosynthesis
MPDRRRFAFVCPNFYPRVCGISDYSARLANELTRRGHEVRIFSRAPAEPHPEAPALEFHSSSRKTPVLIAADLARAIETFRPTDFVLHYTAQMWDIWRFGSPALVWLADRVRRMHATVTLVVHEPFIPWRARPDLALGSLLQRLQLAALLTRCDRSFVTTATRVEIVAPLARLVGAPPPTVTRVGPGAMPLPPATDRRPALSTPRIGFFSTITRGKRFDVVLDAFATLVREIPGAQLVILGDLGPENHPGAVELRQAVSRHPAADRIRITGKLPLKAIAVEIAALDLYLFPMDTGANTRTSTLPVALGSGIPSIAIKGRETDELVFRDGENIIFARDLTAAAFGEAALRLLGDATLLARVGAGARRIYDDHVSWDKIADRFLTDLSRSPA